MTTMITTIELKQTAAITGLPSRWKTTPTFGLHVLIVEDEEGHYEPIANVSTINEAKELVADDLRCRRERLERDEDPSVSTVRLQAWARGLVARRVPSGVRDWLSRAPPSGLEPAR